MTTPLRLSQMRNHICNSERITTAPIATRSVAYELLYAVIRLVVLALLVSVLFWHGCRGGVGMVGAI